MMQKIRVAIFASGNGTNAEEFFKHFQNSPTIEVACLGSNNPNAFALTRAKKWGKETFSFTRNEFFKERKVIDYLEIKSIDFIVLAGFMWLLPSYLVNAYSDRLLNIHPSLLPRYGGKGMYGDRVHKAVIEAGENESGITIHMVNDEFDKGKILFQTTVPISKNDTPETLATKIHKLEHEHYPKVAEHAISLAGKKRK